MAMVKASQDTCCFLLVQNAGSSSCLISSDREIESAAAAHIFIFHIRKLWLTIIAAVTSITVVAAWIHKQSFLSAFEFGPAV